MSEKKLPISYSTPFSTDCRIGLKLAVIQTSPHSDAWMATHLGVFMDSLLNVRIGDELIEMHLDDFDDILYTRKINIWNTPHQKIVEVIINQINQNKYVMIDCYMWKQYPEQSGNEIQSILIYGYNKNDKNFYCLSMVNKQFTESSVSFDLLQRLYSDMLEVYQDDPKKKTLRQMSYHPLGIMELKSYSEDNSVYNSLIYKIQVEFSGGIYHVRSTDVYGEKSSDVVWFKGIDCLTGLKDKLDELMTGSDEEIKNIVPYGARGAYILYEHRKRIQHDMEWISSKLQLNNERVLQIIQEYQNIANNLKKLHYLLNKAWIICDRDIISRAIDILTKQYQQEKTLLYEFVNTSFEYYIYTQSYDFNKYN